MKRILSVLVLGLAGIAIANANEPTNTELKDITSLEIKLEVMSAQDSVKRTLVQPADLPEAVRTTLNGDEYQGWVILNAYHVEPAEATSFYEITLQRVEEQELKVVKLDASGRVVD